MAKVETEAEYLEMVGRYLASARPTIAAHRADRPPGVFLSYTRSDAPQVKALFRQLTDLGFRVWMDTENLYGGEKWSVAVKKAIREADFFVLCISERSRNRRGFLQKEIKEALSIAEERARR